MKNAIILFFSVAFIAQTAFAGDPITFNEFELDFIEGNLKEAKAKASTEGRLTFVEFYADWCTPCKVMEKNVLSNDKIVDYLKDNYVPVRINVDDFDGYAWKQHYNVSPLPTILILNSQGELVERISESVSVSQLYNVLSRHNISDNRIAKEHEVNTSPTVLRSQKQADSNSKVSRSKYAATGAHSGKSFKLQLGTFESYEGASIFYNDLRTKIEEPIIVLNDYAYGVVRYRIMVGEFNSEEDASTYKEILKEKYSIDSFIF